jgi:hypothetical protein
VVAINLQHKQDHKHLHRSVTKVTQAAPL